MANHISHAALPFPIFNARYTVLVPYLDADGDPTDPTTPDTEVSQDAGAYADATEEVTTITGSNGTGYITLTAQETDCSAVALAFKVASGPKATVMTLYPRRLPILESGTASAGAAGSITLASGTYTGLNLSNCFVRTTGGTGGGTTANQARRIISYNTGTRVATVAPDWETTPDATTTYDILLPEGVLVSMLTALPPTTLGRTLDVSAGGEAGLDWANIGSPTTTVNLSGTTVKTATDVETDTADIQTRLPAALVSGRMDSYIGATAASLTFNLTGNITGNLSGSVGSVTGAVGSVTATVNANVTQFGGTNGTFASGRPEVNTTHWLGSACATPTVAGVPEVDVTYILGFGIDTNANPGQFPADIQAIGGDTAGVSGLTSMGDSYTSNGYINSNVSHISTDATAANNLEAALDGTGGVTITAAITGNITGNLSGSVGSVTGNVGGNVTGSVGSIATGGITSASFAAGAINNAAMSIDGSELTAIPWNASWDAEVQSEVQDAIEVNNLDHLVKNAVDTDFATTVHLNSVIGHLADNGTSATFDRTTDSLEAIYNSIDAVPTTTETATAVWGEAQEGGYTARQIHELNGAVLWGILSGMSTGAATFKGLDGTTTRVAATVDSYGNRSGFTITPRAV